LQSSIVGHFNFPSFPNGVFEDDSPLIYDHLKNSEPDRKPPANERCNFATHRSHGTKIFGVNWCCLALFGAVWSKIYFAYFLNNFHPDDFQSSGLFGKSAFVCLRRNH
jgi:hypothetical protein